MVPSEPVTDRAETVSRDAAPELAASDNPPKLTIVMPVWNEGERVVPTIRALAAAVRTPFELLVVHDMPDDTTVPVVERLSAEVPGLRAHRNELGRGVLNAMKAGMAVARAPYVLITMAD